MPPPDPRRPFLPNKPRGVAPPAELVDVTITALGGQGDGLAQQAGRTVYVPFTVPGDRVRVRLAGEQGRPVEWLERGADRAEPPCPHFGRCGGCALQHVADAAYATWKLARLQAALAQYRLTGVEIGQLLRIPPGQRRRAEFAVQRAGAAVRIGFHGHRTREIIEIGPCPVLLPAIVDLLPALRAGLRDVLRDGEAADLFVGLADGGVDALITLARTPDRATLEALAALAQSGDLARISWRRGDGPADIVAERRRPRAIFATGTGAIAVDLPPGAFLQASEAGERAIVDNVLGATGPARRLLDLYAGCGTLALPLAAAWHGRSVHAVEGDAAMATALSAAARNAGLGSAVTATARDLARRPLLAPELAGYDAIVFDPPFNGAREQSQAIAASPVRRIVGVSCNPVTFARDARILVDGGCRLVAVQPIDQFVWSTHLELVALFER
jgi:23S rRNA (uracil1939-C5)-methyltransferase